MCDRIHNTETGEDIETQIGLMLLVGIDTYRRHEPDDPAPDKCLCHIDYEPMLQEAGFVCHHHNGDPTDMLIAHRDGWLKTTRTLPTPTASPDAEAPGK